MNSTNKPWFHCVDSETFFLFFFFFVYRKWRFFLFKYFTVTIQSSILYSVLFESTLKYLCVALCAIIFLNGIRVASRTIFRITLFLLMFFVAMANDNIFFRGGGTFHCCLHNVVVTSFFLLLTWNSENVMETTMESGNIEKCIVVDVRRIFLIKSKINRKLARKMTKSLTKEKYLFHTKLIQFKVRFLTGGRKQRRLLLTFSQFIYEILHCVVVQNKYG